MALSESSQLQIENHLLEDLAKIADNSLQWDDCTYLGMAKWFYCLLREMHDSPLPFHLRERMVVRRKDWEMMHAWGIVPELKLNTRKLFQKAVHTQGTNIHLGVFDAWNEMSKSNLSLDFTEDDLRFYLSIIASDNSDEVPYGEEHSISGYACVALMSMLKSSSYLVLDKPEVVQTVVGFMASKTEDPDIFEEIRSEYGYREDMENAVAFINRIIKHFPHLMANIVNARAITALLKLTVFLWDDQDTIGNALTTLQILAQTKEARLIIASSPRVYNMLRDCYFIHGQDEVVSLVGSLCADKLCCDTLIRSGLLNIIMPAEMLTELFVIPELTSNSSVSLRDCGMDIDAHACIFAPILWHIAMHRCYRELLLKAKVLEALEPLMPFEDVDTLALFCLLDAGEHKNTVISPNAQRRFASMFMQHEKFIEERIAVAKVFLAFKLYGPLDEEVYDMIGGEQALMELVQAT